MTSTTTHAGSSFVQEHHDADERRSEPEQNETHSVSASEWFDELTRMPSRGRAVAGSAAAGELVFSPVQWELGAAPLRGAATLSAIALTSAAEECDLGLSPVQEAVRAEFARRVAPTMVMIMEGTQWLSDLEERAAFTNASTPTVQRLFGLLFEEGSLMPSSRIDSQLDAIASCVESAPVEDQPYLAALVENTIASR